MYLKLGIVSELLIEKKYEDWSSDHLKFCQSCLMSGTIVCVQVIGLFDIFTPDETVDDFEV